MPGIRGAGSLMITAALLVIFFAQEPMGGLSPAEAAALLGLGGVAMIMAAAIIEGFSRHWTYGVQSIAMSGGFFAPLISLASRGELQTVLDRHRRCRHGPHRRFVQRRGGGGPETDGSFLIKGSVNGHEARFIFDTGASTVVLRAENAAALGFKPEALNYSIPVSTANGTALAAPSSSRACRSARSPRRTSPRSSPAPAFSTPTCSA